MRWCTNCANLLLAHQAVSSIVNVDLISLSSVLSFVYVMRLERLPYEFGSEEFSAAGTDEQLLYPSRGRQMAAHCNIRLKVSDGKGAQGSG
ncbi:hypothetical protein ACQKWADRAFT_287285 [Trichoderma austrokoningii]